MTRICLPIGAYLPDIADNVSSRRRPECNGIERPAWRNTHEQRGLVTDGFFPYDSSPRAGRSLAGHGAVW